MIDHRLVRDTIKISKDQKNTKPKKKTKPWTHLTNEEVFRQYIDNKLQNNPASSDINEVNNNIVDAINQEQNYCSPRSEKEQKISQETKMKKEELRLE